uniref:Uncharacterized protein n=1 Tax=Panagrolaimus sp. JU765 TaxID=591449 RepID=A0AC34RTJ0_9BILA
MIRLFCLGLVFGIVAFSLADEEKIRIKVVFDDQLDDVVNGTLDREFAIVDDERILLPKKIPKLSWKEKEALILASGVEMKEILERKKKRRHRVSRKTPGKKRRSLSDSPWRRTHAVAPSAPKPSGPPIAADVHQCPAKIDAVTEAHNHRTYVFAGDHVYQVYRDRQGLQQKSAFLITELFPAGPRRVSAALTNLRSAVTVLIEYNTVYRFRWSKKNQRFYLARKSPQKLDRNITFTPKLAFQWSDGNMILTDGKQFATYDAYWNVATFIGKTDDYFPGVPSDSVGLAHSGADTYIWMNNRASLQVYNMKKYRVIQEYPVRISDYVACLAQFKKS